MLSDLNRGEVREEGNLLIEAVSLLVQRQRETESWIAEQIWQAEERAAASERLSVEFESRLAGIEEQLGRLLYEVEPLRGDADVDQRLERLRVQVESLRASPDARMARPTPVIAAPSGSAQPLPSESPPDARRATGGRPAAVTRTQTASTSGQGGVGFWELLGASPQDRFGLLLIGAGGVAVLYAILTQLRFG